MKRNLILCLLLIFLCAGEFVLAAQGTSAQYTIEIVMFAQDAPDSGETWPEDPGQPDLRKAVDILISDSPQIVARDQISDSMVQEPLSPLSEVSLLPTETLGLSSVAYTLRKKGLPTLLHIGWRQPVGRWKSPDWHWIQTDNLMGLLRVTKGRFLHLDVDLLVQDPATGQQYRVIGQRKMRSKELHHMDHPKLGIITRIDSYNPLDDNLNETQ